LFTTTEHVRLEKLIVAQLVTVDSLHYQREDFVRFQVQTKVPLCLNNRLAGVWSRVNNPLLLDIGTR
jgi:hypothetical protein